MGSRWAGMGRVNAESWTSQIKKVDIGSGDPLLVLLDFHLFKWSYNIYCWTACSVGSAIFQREGWCRFHFVYQL